MQKYLNQHPIIVTPNQQGRNVANSEDHNVVELVDILFSSVILPFVPNDLLHHSTVQIRYVLINILAQLGNQGLLVEHGHVDLEVFLPLRYVTQRAVEVFMKWHRLAHKSLNVAVGHTLVEAASWVCLSHELEEPSEGSGVRRLLRQEVIHSGLNRWEGLRDIHEDLILALNKVKLLEEEARGILISQNEV
jgi:enamine deaminase RidA (YjgF/YER057c/UK114 family)